MHLYVHVPFCARRCSYCDFAIAVRRDTPSRRFVDAVLKEWRTWQSEPAWSASPSLDTVYFGGGTPSRLDPAELTRFLRFIGFDRRIAPGAEVTLEANPDDVTVGLAAAWREAGVNRISLGVQSFDDNVLRWMHRTHDAAAVSTAMTALRDAGFGNISVDLIFALPEVLNRDLGRDLDLVLGLDPEHLSLYGLTVEEGTPLGRWTARGQSVPSSDERYAAEYLASHERLVSAGFEHYEVSNAGKPGHRAQHNSAYWRQAPFIGIGPAAHSALDGWRGWNLPQWVEYERAIMSGAAVQQSREQLDPSQVTIETLYLGLRTTDGLATALLPPAAVDEWKRQGWATVAGDRIRLTPEGWLRLDALVRSVA